MWHPTPGSIGKHILIVVLIAALGAGLWYAGSALRQPTALAAITQQPADYVGGIVYVSVAQAREGTPILGWPSWQVSDDGKSFVTLISRQPLAEGTIACVAVHTPDPFGQVTVVLEQRPDSIGQAVEELLGRIAPRKPASCPEAPTVTGQDVSGTVAEETRLLGLTALSIQCADGKARTVVLKSEGVPVGAQVETNARPVAGLGVEGMAELYEADEVITHIDSITANPQAFADRSVVVQGEITGGISLMGSGALELSGDRDESIVVLGGGQAPDDGAEAKVRGNVRYLVGMGKVAWQMLCAESVEPVTAQPSATPPTASK